MSDKNEFEPKIIGFLCNWCRGTQLYGLYASCVAEELTLLLS